ncbi:MAG: hypothetical protein ABSC04_19620 [Syntrophobacteraceae bacterium]|jgi:hypothetical protein
MNIKSDVHKFGFKRRINVYAACQIYESSDFEGANLRFLVAKWWEKFEGKPVGVSGLFGLSITRSSSLEAQLCEE